MDIAAEPKAANLPPDRDELHWKANDGLWKHERMERIGGLICYSAPAPILREQALMIHRLRVRRANDPSEMDYHFLAHSSSKDSWYGDGEVQIFADYMDRVGAAKEARQMVVENPNEAVTCETMQESISLERDHVKSGRKFRNRRPITRGKLFRAGRSS